MNCGVAHTHTHTHTLSHAFTHTHTHTHSHTHTALWERPTNIDMSESNAILTRMKVSMFINVLMT